MAAKTTDWRPGPTVCRCCLSEGCYKDISTEYFWMGKREVYSEMLLDTLSLSIAYAQSGPNSNSRLICEPCIARLRDASDFRRQVQECEKTFMQYLDPGNAALREVEVPVDQLETHVKMEPVKVEKQGSDDEFNDRADFGADDDDDDDLDDQPLTKLASKIPKKEAVDLLDLLDNAKAGEKRKSSTKSKTSPAKKAKSKKETKATSSKAAKPEKKKKGDAETTSNNAIIPNLKAKMEERMDLSTNIKDDVEAKVIGRGSAINLLTYSSGCPFRILSKYYMCYYCDHKYTVFSELFDHTSNDHKLDAENITKTIVNYGRYNKIKVNFSDCTCKICNKTLSKFDELKQHLTDKHNKRVDAVHDGVIPYKISGVSFGCILCPEKFEKYKALNDHINSHYPNFVCGQCGMGFATVERLRIHTLTHSNVLHKCDYCDKIFRTLNSKREHVTRIHMKGKRNTCLYCMETFIEYFEKVRHMANVHGEKLPEYKCSHCPNVYHLSYHLKQHVRKVHLKTIQHQCHICGRKLSKTTTLKDHMISHSGEKNFKCEVCDKTYRRKKTLVEHMRIHNNDKRFACEYCSSAFVQKSSLTSHIKTHHRNVHT